MERIIKFILNDKQITVEEHPGLVLLDFIRNKQRLKGTKEGCREGDCGACAVLIGEYSDDGVKYRTVNSCLFPLGNTVNKHIVTIEGLNSGSLSPIQKYFVEEGASQCGFCTPGFIIAFSGYLLNNSKLVYSEAINAVAGNICRCTGYTSIKHAIKRLIDNVILSPIADESHLQSLIDLNLIPKYFLEIPAKLKDLMESKTGTTEIHESDYLVGGGTDLFVQKPEELSESKLTFLAASRVPKIKFEDDFCLFSGDVTFEMIKESLELKKYFPQMMDNLNLVASKPIRNSATIAGNIANASPIGDLIIILLALDSCVILKNGKKQREIKLKNFYKDYKILDKTPEEFIEWIKLKLPTNGERFSFEKVSKRTYLDIASVNSAMLIGVKNDLIERINLSAGGVSPIPMNLVETNKFMLNKELTPENILKSLEIIDTEIKPIDDIRGTAEYKRLLLKQLIKAHFIKLFPEKISFENLL